MSRTNRTGKLKRRLKTSIGGIVEGIKVPRTKEDPAEARNPITGQPYQETTGLLASLRRLKNPRMRRQDGGELRIDGTKKSMQGFLGPIKNSRGQIMTELSIGVEMDGKEIEIPTLVPTLNDQDIQVLQNLSDDAPIPESIIKKSVAHAQERMKENKDPFYQDGEEKEPRDRFALGGSIYRYLEGKFSELAGLKTDDIAWAKEQGKAYGAAQELDGKGDAKRHILLGWLAKQSPSPRVASLGIKAREFIDPSGRKMDEFNNQLGYTFPDSIETREDAIKEADRLIESNQALFYTPKESRQMRGY